MPTRKRATPPEPTSEQAQPVETIEPMLKAIIELPQEQALEPIFTKPILAPIKEPEIINSFYDAIGLRYCHKCGEAKRTNNTGETFCPTARADCRGLVD